MFPPPLRFPHNTSTENKEYMKCNDTQFPNLNVENKIYHVISGLEHITPVFSKTVVKWIPAIKKSMLEDMWCAFIKGDKSVTLYHTKTNVSCTRSKLPSRGSPQRYYPARSYCKGGVSFHGWNIQDKEHRKELSTRTESSGTDSHLWCQLSLEQSTQSYSSVCKPPPSRSSLLPMSEPKSWGKTKLHLVIICHPRNCSLIPPFPPLTVFSQICWHQTLFWYSLWHQGHLAPSWFPRCTLRKTISREGLQSGFSMCGP